MRDHILDLAGSNPRVAETLRESLTILRDNGSEKLGEMARDVLDGAPPRELALSSVYGDELGAGFSRFWKKYQAMDPEERSEIEENIRTRFRDTA